jgi:hypothetical protein
MHGRTYDDVQTKSAPNLTDRFNEYYACIVPNKRRGIDLMPSPYTPSQLRRVPSDRSISFTGIDASYKEFPIDFTSIRKINNRKRQSKYELSYAT